MMDVKSSMMMLAMHNTMKQPFCSSKENPNTDRSWDNSE